MAEQKVLRVVTGHKLSWWINNSSTFGNVLLGCQCGGMWEGPEYEVREFFSQHLREVGQQHQQQFAVVTILE